MSYIERISEHWSPVPDWLLALAEECDRTSLSKSAQRIGRSPACVSQVLRNIYPGNIEGVEEMVRGALMKTTIACPALGELRRDQCQIWRNRANGPLISANSQSVQMFRACRRCAHFPKDPS